MAIRARRRYQGERFCPGIWAYLNGEAMPEEEGPARDNYVGLEFFGNIATAPHQLVGLAEVWATHRAAVVEAWTDAKPGTRPPAWWRFDAPQEARRLRRAGDDEAEVLARLGLLSAGEKVSLGLL